MGHQVNFFVMPADLPDLETAIRTAGDICFLAAKSPTGEPVELASIASGPAAGPGGLRTCFIVQRKDVVAVSTRFVKPQGCWLIAGTESPVIEFGPGVFSGARLSRGRAYFGSDLRFRPELPDPEFVRWGNRVLTRIKKALTRNPAFGPPWIYFGAGALDWIENSGATMNGGLPPWRSPTAAEASHTGCPNARLVRNFVCHQKKPQVSVLISGRFQDRDTSQVVHFLETPPVGRYRMAVLSDLKDLAGAELAVPPVIAVGRAR